MHMQVTSVKNVHSNIPIHSWEEIDALGLVDFGQGLVQSDIFHTDFA